MRIRSKVRDIRKFMPNGNDGFKLFVALTETSGLEEAVRRTGLSFPLVLGERMLPDGGYGPASRRNAYGEEIVHKELPLETHYRQKEWTCSEYHGRDNRVERTKIVEVPYKRYPRSSVPPHSVELEVRANVEGTPVLTAGPFDSEDAVENAILLNTVHLFIEAFGECELLLEDLLASRTPTRRLNWEILPPGRYPWARAKVALERVITETKPSNQAVINARFKELAEFEPDFLAVGRGGFSRYVVYGWDAAKLYVLESTEVDNATYVLKADWERLSAMTKAEILSQDAHFARLVHRKTWFKGINELLKQEGLQPSSAGTTRRGRQ